MPSYENWPWSCSRLIHFCFSAFTSPPFVVILNSGDVGVLRLSGASSLSTLRSTILPNIRPTKALLNFCLPDISSSQAVQCLSICETFILPHSAWLLSFRLPILLISSSLVALSSVVFISGDVSIGYHKYKSCATQFINIRFFVTFSPRNI